ncbi:universal stress protein UspA [Methanoculleus sediminis]|uniref:Universal stress protein UspA n=1 Tax=Methanoculleus sediminis TaxID=1550566 RepID=A0A0H1R1X2_9EURY|nr:universal stress protein [Methanoculleus sediminis]KLK88786.1 universal stress protein UspA [Methanoculleus sediminis]
MFEKTLIPVAYGERPEEVRKVGTILKSLGAGSVCLYHVNEPGSFFRGADLSWLTLLAEALEETGLAVEVKTGEGHIASAIAETALLEGVDGIYMKAKRRWHIETMLLGSVSRDLLRLADVPVFVHKVRPRLPDDGAEPDHSDLAVLYATDLDEASARPLPYVMEFRGAWCHVLHVRGRMADPLAERVRREAVDEQLNAVAEELRPYFGRVTAEQRIGNPAAQVLHVSDRIEADVVVLGRKSPAFLSAPMGDTAERIVTGSSASIFLVPQPGSRNAS